MWILNGCNFLIYVPMLKNGPISIFYKIRVCCAQCGGGFVYLHAYLRVNCFKNFETLPTILGENFGFHDMNPIYIFHVFTFEWHFVRFGLFLYLV